MRDADKGAEVQDSKAYLAGILAKLRERCPEQVEFLQAVDEVLETLTPILDRRPDYIEGNVVGRLVDPERVFMFRVSWVDDEGVVRVNRGYRVQMNNALGPYKGGLRFHRSVNLSILKFLAFEQVFKNSLTNLPLGGGKGGSDFDPRGRSDGEVMRFCQSFMSALFPHIGHHRDVPAGDIGVGGREIGYLFGQFKRLANRFEGAITGKDPGWGGSLIRPEATGYGAVYFLQEMLKTRGDGLEGKVCTVSGSGNVAQYAVEKIIHLGGKAVTLSDSSGVIHDPDGIDAEKLAWVMELKNERRGRIGEYAEQYPGATYHDGKEPWIIPCDVALPCATQNEISDWEAKELVANGCTAVSEGANMPSEPDSIEIFIASGVLYGPGKAANAGGVSVSGLEMSQNAMHTRWTREKVDSNLQRIMSAIHLNCQQTAEEFGKPGNYVLGANVAGFRRVADAMLAQGVV